MAAKKFKFRMAPLLKIREHREKERQKEYALAARKTEEQKEALTSLDHDRLNTLEHRRQRQVGVLSVADALVCGRYLMKLKRQRLAGTELLQALDKEAEKKRRELVVAARDRKIFESLKEKQLQRYLEESEKADQKELDEVATTAFRRNQKKSGR